MWSIQQSHECRTELSGLRQGLERVFGRFTGENTLNPELADYASGVLVTCPSFPAQSHKPVVAKRPIAGCKRDNTLAEISLGCQGIELQLRLQ
jgi:hypothetical protein